MKKIFLTQKTDSVSLSNKQYVFNKKFLQKKYIRNYIRRQKLEKRYLYHYYVHRTITRIIFIYR